MSGALLPDPAHERLTRLWQAHRPAGPMLPWELKTVYGDRWVRFHSLPESKRYAKDEAEYAVLLDRYNTVLDELFAGGEAYVVTTDWADPSEPTDYSAHRAHTRWYFYADRRPWRRGCLDQLLRAVADDTLPGIFVADTELTRIHHPYDGGADVILATPEERDRLRDCHSTWLPAHPSGY
ncbi:hypothetical protein OG851_25095 [Streptomyces sp. NBC_00161]|uniref:DUF3885 domain-containing protein n=1 Tax=Streptomyces sp. NBC_00161 TaxID=2975671 RepID=UPI003249F475